MSWATHRQVAVIDNGSGFTKMGFSGNDEPQYIVPTAIAAASDGDGAGLSDLEFLAGSEAVGSKTHAVNYPIKHGLIDNWNSMERLWGRCFYDYLRCDAEEHYVMLTEPPLNPPENREYTAEVMFETFGVPGLYIGVQAVLALAASWEGRSPASQSLTGTVVDSGDGVTHVIPVVEGYVIPSAIKHIPLAGRDITHFVQRMLRERGEPVPPEDSLEVATSIKTHFAYIGQDMLKEYAKFDGDPAKYFRKATFRAGRTNKEYTIDVGYEQFLAPELFFNPEIYSADFITPLPQVVDESILQCPVDNRRALYRNIVLSGGSTMFRNFHRRLQVEVKERVEARVALNMDRIRSRLGAAAAKPPEEMKVKVVQHDRQRFAVWYGGSLMGSMDGFEKWCHTKEEYFERGPSIARHNPVFNATM